MPGIILNRSLFLKDTLNGGPGTISEYVSIAATGEPLARQVRLCDRITGAVIRKTVSAADGLYTFSNISIGRQYIVYALDHTGVFDGVIADRVTAVVPS